MGLSRFRPQRPAAMTFTAWRWTMPTSADVREAVIEAIESAGLVVSATIPFNRMLERTGKALEYHLIPYIDAETVQFCSTRLA